MLVLSYLTLRSSISAFRICFYDYWSISVDLPGHEKRTVTAHATSRNHLNIRTGKGQALSELGTRGREDVSSGINEYKRKAPLSHKLATFP